MAIRTRRVSITIPIELADMLDSVTENHHISRSAIITGALMGVFMKEKSLVLSEISKGAYTGQDLAQWAIECDDAE